MKKLLLGLLGAFLLLVLVLVLRTVTASSLQPSAGTPTDRVGVLDADALAARLGEAVRFRTVAGTPEEGYDAAPFEAFHAWMQERFPATHTGLKREVVAGHSLLYTWKGLDPTLPPIVLVAHQDVVPVSDDTLGDWTHSPWSGEVRDGWIWGRGTLDDKVAVVGILEAVEALWGSGFQPTRTVHLAFGHDEEVSGTGAMATASLLRERGVSPLFVLDEGLAVTHGIVPGLEAPAALVGLAEKGYLTVELTATGEGGHSSMPPAHTAVGVLADAVTALEADPMPIHMDGPLAHMFTWLGPEMGFGNKLVFRNLWLLGPVVASKLASGLSTNASIRTTTAVTMFDGGVKENVLPQSATAVVNFRLHPSDSREDVLKHVARVADPRGITVKPRAGLGGGEARVSSVESEGWRLVSGAVKTAFPDAHVAPGMSVGATDARFYAALSDSVYRFSPIRLHKDTHDTGRIHGTDERVSVENYAEVVRFYAQLIVDATSGEAPTPVPD